MELKIQRVIVFVLDMAVMTRFYREVLGLQRSAEAESMEDWQVFSAGGMELALHAIPKEFAEGIVIDEPPEPRVSAVTKLVFKVEDIDTTQAELTRRGAIPLDRPGLNPPGRRERCDFLDPEGNVFQISIS